MAENLTLIDTENIEKAGGPWTKLAVSVVFKCPKIKKEREREIIFDRFGIGKNPKTLHAIGQKYGITRERVRQIVNNAIRKIQKNIPAEAKPKIEKIEKTVINSGGYAPKDVLSKKLGVTEKTEQNAIRFIASLSIKMETVKESNILKQGWAEKKIKLTKIKDTSKEAVSYLRDQKETKTSKAISEAIKIDEKFAEAVLSGTKSIMETDDGKWGLTSWPDVNPKSIKDKSKYVMVRHGKPLHYADLAKKISDIGIRRVTKQSVHNELIKNPEFVLVGRGIYALTEWGYEPGVVEEVIVAVLNDAEKPLHKDEIIELVLKRRIVKPSTIVLNLQKPTFKRVGKATYTIN